jgi:SWI/SNF-related matrix-associated actin-dependent regulator 1 of chromatin subfamily A
MLTVRPDSYIHPTCLEFEHAGSIPFAVQEVLGKQTWPLKEYEQLRTKVDECLAKKLLTPEQVDWFPHELLHLCRLPKQDTSMDRLEREIGSYLFRAISSDYQRQGVKYMVDRGGRGLLADEPGLGKTLQAIMLLLFYRSKLPAVIVCPALPKLTWQLELAQWLIYPYFEGCTPPLSRLINQYLDPVQVLTSGKSIPSSRLKKWVTIVSYDLLRNDQVFDFLQKRVKARILVVDECHYMKHSNAKRTQAVTKLAAKMDHVLLLSGTPLSRCQDLFAQVHCLHPAYFPLFFYKSFQHWKASAEKYAGPHRLPFYFAEYFCQGTFRQQRMRFGGKKIWLPATGGSCRQDVLHQILSNHILIQRTQKTVLKDELLPVERIRYVMPNPVKKQDLVIAKKDRKELKMYVLELYNALAAIKEVLAPLFLKYYLSLHDDGKTIPKTLIWAHHHVVMDSIQKFCEDNKIGFIRIDGTVPDKERVKMVEAFKVNNGVKVAILSLLACNTSLNLQVATVNIFVQLHWDVFQLDQAEKRANRKGQTKQVRSYYVLAEDTLDKMLWQNITRAYRNATLLTQGTEDKFLAAFERFQANSNNDDLDDAATN